MNKTTSIYFEIKYFISSDGSPHFDSYGDFLAFQSQPHVKYNPFSLLKVADSSCPKK